MFGSMLCTDRHVHRQPRLTAGIAHTTDSKRVERGYGGVLVCIIERGDEESPRLFVHANRNAARRVEGKLILWTKDLLALRVLHALERLRIQHLLLQLVRTFGWMAWGYVERPNHQVRLVEGRRMR